MGGWTEMALALEKRMKPEAGPPVRPPESEAESQMEVSVVFTSVKATLAALRTAGTLACACGTASPWWYRRSSLIPFR